MPKDDDFVACPFDNQHKMLRKRLLPHIIKCRLLYPDVELLKCPFNQSHLVPQPEYVQHVTSCESGKIITDYKYNALPVKEEEIVQHAPIECDENWDDDMVDDYDPKQKILKANVLRNPNALLRADRSAFNEEESKRQLEREDDYEECKPPFRPLKTDTDYSDDDADEAAYDRPITPQPPTGIDWTAGTSTAQVKRERSRSPLFGRCATVKSELEDDQTDYRDSSNATYRVKRERF